MQMRYRELYDRGRRILESVPIPDAALDARLLLEKACGTNLQTLLASPDRPVEEEELRIYQELIERRRLREPTAMILGEWDFMGLTFKVTKDTLIPEQDTEVLVETVLDRMQETVSRNRSGGSFRRDAGDQNVQHVPETPRNETEMRSEIRPKEDEVPMSGEPLILDLCTGSGCILLSLLHVWPGARGIGTDISEGALAAARDNAGALRLSDRSLWFQGDLWDALPGESEQDAHPWSAGPDNPLQAQPESGPVRTCRGAFDLIVSNPPYVPTAVIPTLEPEVRCGEPYAALDGGSDGLEFYRRIIDRAAIYLKEDGLLALEAGFDEAAQICTLLKRAGYTDIRVDRDYGGRNRVVSARLNRQSL